MIQKRTVALSIPSRRVRLASTKPPSSPRAPETDDSPALPLNAEVAQAIANPLQLGKLLRKLTQLRGDGKLLGGLCGRATAIVCATRTALGRRPRR